MQLYYQRKVEKLGTCEFRDDDYAHFTREEDDYRLKDARTFDDVFIQENPSWNDMNDTLSLSTVIAERMYSTSTMKMRGNFAM